MTSAINSSGNSVSRLCDIINTTQNDITSSAVDKYWILEGINEPTIEVFPAYDEIDIPNIEIFPSDDGLNVPSIETFPIYDDVDIPNIETFPMDESDEMDNIIFIDGVGNLLKEVEFSTKQVGKKWGEHMKDYPNLRSYDEYKNFAQDVFNNPEKIFYDRFEDEYLYVRGEDLLRVKPDGSFVSIYPGADSAKVTKVIERGGELIWQQ